MEIVCQVVPLWTCTTILQLVSVCSVHQLVTLATDPSRPTAYHVYHLSNSTKAPVLVHVPSVTTQQHPTFVSLATLTALIAPTAPPTAQSARRAPSSTLTTMGFQFAQSNVAQDFTPISLPQSVRIVIPHVSTAQAHPLPSALLVHQVLFFGKGNVSAPAPRVLPRWLIHTRIIASAAPKIARNALTVQSQVSAASPAKEISS